MTGKLDGIPVKQRILIIDDEQDIIDTLVDILDESHYEIVSHCNPIDALQEISSQSFDLIITDIVMPRLSGLEIIRETKEIYPDALIIVVSGHATLDTALQSIKLGVHDFITKPFKAEVIKITVKNALEKQLLENENRQLNRKIQNMLSNITLLYEISSIIYQLNDFKSAIDMVLDTCSEYFKMHHTCIMLEDSVSGEFCISGKHGLDDEFCNKFRFSKHDLINEKTIDSEKKSVVSVSGGKINLNDRLISIDPEVEEISLYPLSFKEKLYGFITNVRFLNEAPINEITDQLVKVLTTQISPVMQSFVTDAKTEIVSENFVHQLIKERIFEAEKMMIPISYALFRISINKGVNDTLILGDYVNNYRNYFKELKKKNTEIIWLTLDTALLVLPDSDLFMAESQCKKIAQDVESLIIEDQEKVIITHYATMGYPQSGSNARGIHQMLWCKLMDEVRHSADLEQVS